MEQKAADWGPLLNEAVAEEMGTSRRSSSMQRFLKEREWIAANEKLFTTPQRKGSGKQIRNGQIW
jgi:hypothetical protein